MVTRHRCSVHRDDERWWTYIVDEDGYVIDDADVQLARVAAVVH